MFLNSIDTHKLCFFQVQRCLTCYLPDLVRVAVLAVNRELTSFLLKYIVYVCRRGRVMALDAAVSSSIPGRVEIYNIKLSPWD